MEERFYRQLFLKRYALLLEKAERTYSIPKETMDALKRKVLSLDWVDPGVALLRQNQRNQRNQSNHPTPPT